MGQILLLNKAVVSWYSKKQKTVLTSTTKAEYFTIGYATKESVWIKRFINKIYLEIIDLMLNEDNEVSINPIKNLENQSYIKYINIHTLLYPRDYK